MDTPGDSLKCAWFALAQSMLWQFGNQWTPTISQLEKLYPKLEKQLGFKPGQWNGNRPYYRKEQLALMAKAWIKLKGGANINLGLIKQYDGVDDFAEVVGKIKKPSEPIGPTLWVRYNEGQLDTQAWQGIRSDFPTKVNRDRLKQEHASLHCDAGLVARNAGTITSSWVAKPTDPPKPDPPPRGMEDEEERKRRHQDAFDKLPKSMCRYEGDKGYFWVYSRDCE